MLKTSRPWVEFMSRYPAKKYGKDELILSFDEPVVNVCYLAKGFIRVYSFSKIGEQKTYTFLQEGEIFPIIWTLNNVNKNLYYEAMGEVVIHETPKNEFLDFINQKAGAWEALLHDVVGQLSLYVDRVGNLETTKGRERLTETLVNLAKCFGKEEKGGVWLPIPITHTDLATYAAMSRETASREMERLQKRGLVTKLRKRYFLTNLQKLVAEL